MKTLNVVRAAVAVLLLVDLLFFAMPWSYLPLLVANVDTQAILTRTELRHTMAPLIVAASMAITWIALDAYLSFRLARRQQAANGGRKAAPADAPKT